MLHPTSWSLDVFFPTESLGILPTFRVDLHACRNGRRARFIAEVEQQIELIAQDDPSPLTLLISATSSTFILVSRPSVYATLRDEEESWLRLPTTVIEEQLHLPAQDFGRSFRVQKTMLSTSFASYERM